MGVQYDFSGWAATNNVRCTDNTIIRPGAFSQNDGMTVPLVYQHQHTDDRNLLGHAVLQERPKGIYAYAYLNEDTEQGRNAKASVMHGDIKSMSIWANQIKRRKTEEGDEILHGNIREVSLVLAAADPGAYIDYIRHSDGDESNGEAVIYNSANLIIAHSDDEEPKKKKEPEDNAEDGDGMKDREENEGLKEELKKKVEDDTEEYDEEDSEEEDSEEEEKKKAIEHADNSDDSDDSDDETAEDVVNSMNDKQKVVLKALLGKAYMKGVDDAKNGNDKDVDDSKDEGDKGVKHDVFDNDNIRVMDDGMLIHADNKEEMNTLCHAAFKDAANFGGSFKRSFIAHAAEDYGIENIDLLFPDAKAISNTPEFIKRETEWVQGVLSGTRHLPYARIKNLFADITADEARARGYITGKKKLNEFFKLVKRETNPTTIYKKQQLDRDRIIDATTLDVVNFVWSEMRLMLNEEIARAILIGDGREESDESKISETNIRPIIGDSELFTVEELLPAETANNYAALIEAISMTHKRYKGTGSPVMYMGVDKHTRMLWVKDLNGRRIYTSDAELCSALRVSKIIECPLMDDYTYTFSDRTDIADGTYELCGVKVNLNDYACGTDKGGAIDSFNDFDIDYNQYKYLLETRMSGALVKYHAAQAYWLPAESSSEG